MCRKLSTFVERVKSYIQLNLGYAHEMQVDTYFLTPLYYVMTNDRCSVEMKPLRLCRKKTFLNLLGTIVRSIKTSDKNVSEKNTLGNLDAVLKFSMHVVQPSG